MNTMPVQTNINKSKVSLFKSLVLKYLNNVENGCLTLHDEHSTYQFGNETDDISSTIKVLDASFYKKVALEGGIGFADCYINHQIEVDDLLSFFRVLILNREIIDKADSGISRFISKTCDALSYGLFYKNNKDTAKSNILKHYDLGNNFFSLFLDEKMMYSSAKFDDISQSLDEASDNKINHIIEKLDLKPEHHLLEIGSGWGSVAIQACLQSGCQVTTTTISDAQYDYVKNKVQDLGLSDKIIVENCDYRELSGQYDRVVSIEMIEAVGHQYYDVYFNKCMNLLKKDGLFLLQGILIRDNQYDRAKTEVDFIKKYVFPGSCIPSLSEIMSQISKTDLVMRESYDLTVDYAMTLIEWLKRFDANLSKVKSLGFSEEFIRTWRYYLMYCSAGFIENAIMVKQITFSKPEYREDKYEQFNQKYTEL